METVVIYAADSEFSASTVQHQLGLEGIPSVLQINQMPQRPGFNFGAGAWGYILVDQLDEQRARQLAQSAAKALFGSSHDSAFPPAISIRTNILVPALWLFLFVPFPLLFAAPDNEMIVVFAYFYGMGLLLGALILHLNWSRLGPAVIAAVVGLLCLPVLFVMLIADAFDALRRLSFMPAWYRRGQ